MTINKREGQSPKRIDIYLSQLVFTHGQSYVALSRATSPGSLKILMGIDEHNSHYHTIFFLRIYCTK